MICEYCGNKYDQYYGSGRFCGIKCSRGFSTKEKRKYINYAVSKKLSGRKLSKEHICNIVTSWENSEIRKSRSSKKKRISIDILLSIGRRNSKNLKDRIIEESVKEYKCEICGISSYNGKEITLQLHHKNGMHIDNKIENLQILCPNCHSQTDNYAGKNKKGIYQCLK